MTGGGAQTCTVGPNHGSVVVRTSREGLGSRLGHDLVLEVTRWEATVTVPADGIAGAYVSATFETASLKVREGVGGAVPLSGRDMDEIHKNTTQKVLAADRHPRVAFTSTSIASAGGARFVVAGALDLAGTTRPIRFEATATYEDGATRVIATVPIVQSEFGITPYRAFMGALKVRDQVEVAVDVRVPIDLDNTLAGASRTPVEETV